MDNGFPILDAFNDDQAFERHFGSLLDDASTQLPVSVRETEDIVSITATDHCQYLLCPNMNIMERK